MMRRLAIAALLAAPGLSAAPSSTEGKVLIGVDRLVPLIAYSSNKTGNAAVSSSTNVTTISLFGNPLAGNQTLENMPRLGLDYAFPNHFTLGADATLFVTVASSRTATNGQTADLDKVTIFGILPRAGYLLPLSPAATFWPRAGLSYVVLKDIPPSSSTSTTLSQFALNLEALFLLSPVEHVAIALGPVVDVPLSGSTSSGTLSVDSSMLHIGLTAGLNFWF